MLMEALRIGDQEVEVVFKPIKNVHLSVHPPTGRVRIAAPEHMSLDTIRLFAISKLGWIRKQQRSLNQQQRESPREYLDRESHHLWGQRYLLQLEHHDAAPRVSLDHTRLILRIREDTPLSVREAALDGWYREQVRSAATPLITKWQPIIGVQVARLFVRRMKTRWGSCNHRLRTIRLNTDLAKKPPECLEYLIVHEMVHIIEPTHNDQFRQLMARFLPNWQHHRNLLNQLPLRHEEWGY